MRASLRMCSHFRAIGLLFWSIFEQREGSWDPPAPRAPRFGLRHVPRSDLPALGPRCEKFSLFRRLPALLTRFPLVECNPASL